MIITEDIFIETIEALEEQRRIDQKCHEAFTVILPNDYVSGYDNSILFKQLIKLIDKDDWVDYFVWELDFGKNYEEGMIKIHGENFELRTAKDLFKLINLD